MKNGKSREVSGLALFFGILGLNEVYGSKSWPRFTLQYYLGLWVFPLAAALILGYCALSLRRGRIAMLRWGTVDRKERPHAFAFLFGIWFAIGLLTLTIFVVILWAIVSKRN